MITDFAAYLNSFFPVPFPFSFSAFAGSKKAARGFPLAAIPVLWCGAPVTTRCRQAIAHGRRLCAGGNPAWCIHLLPRPLPAAVPPFRLHIVYTMWLLAFYRLLQRERIQGFAVQFIHPLIPVVQFLCDLLEGKPVDVPVCK